MNYYLFLYFIQILNITLRIKQFHFYLLQSFFVKSDQLSPTKISVQGPSCSTKQRYMGPSTSDILT